MCEIHHQEVPIEELGLKFHDTALIEMRRRSGITVLWTDLPGIDATVVNMMTSHDTVFWNFWPYRKWFYSELALQAQFRAPDEREKTAARIASIIRMAGEKKRSDFARLALGSWTHAPEYESRATPTLLDSLAGRHLSVLLPTDQRAAVRTHLDQQAEFFGDTCTIGFDESRGSGAADDLRESSVGALLCRPVEMMSDAILLELCGQAKQIEDNAFSAFCAGLDMRFGLRGMFSFAREFDGRRQAVAEPLFILRAKVAAQTCRLPKLESLVDFVQNPIAYGHETDFRGRLLGVLSAPLEPSAELRAFAYAR